MRDSTASVGSPGILSVLPEALLMRMLMKITYLTVCFRSSGFLSAFLQVHLTSRGSCWTLKTAFLPVFLQAQFVSILEKIRDSTALGWFSRFSLCLSSDTTRVDLGGNLRQVSLGRISRCSVSPQTQLVLFLEKMWDNAAWAGSLGVLSVFTSGTARVDPGENLRQHSLGWISRCSVFPQAQLVWIPEEIWDSTAWAGSLGVLFFLRHSSRDRGQNGRQHGDGADRQPCHWAWDRRHAHR